MVQVGDLFLCRADGYLRERDKFAPGGTLQSVRCPQPWVFLENMNGERLPRAWNMNKDRKYFLSGDRTLFSMYLFERFKLPCVFRDTSE